MCRDFIRENARVEGRSQERLGEPSAGDVRLTLSEGEMEGMSMRQECPRRPCTLRRVQQRESMSQKLAEKSGVSQDWAALESAVHFTERGAAPGGLAPASRARTLQVHSWAFVSPAPFSRGL